MQNESRILPARMNHIPPTLRAPAFASRAESVRIMRGECTHATAAPHEETTAQAREIRIRSDIFMRPH